MGLVVEGIEKSFEGKKVLKGVEFEVENNEFVCILGHSGCGKSTLLNLVAGFLQPDVGMISVNGKEVKKPSRERGVVFQEHALFPWYKVIDNVSFGRGNVVLDDQILRLDIGIQKGKITELSSSLRGEAKNQMNAEGLYVLPGMIDVHVHLDEPGRGDWEGFYHGSASLAAGGCTCYCDMPLNGFPPTVNLPALEQKSHLAVGQSYVDYSFWGGLVPGNEYEIEALSHHVMGFKAFMSSPGLNGEGEFCSVNLMELYSGMKEISKTGKILALHAESDEITRKLTEQAIKAGRTTARDYLNSRPILAELEAVQTALLFAEKTGCRLHFVHISSAEAVDRIHDARGKGLDVSLETCPHYLMLNERDFEAIGGVAKCAPPLRSAEQQKALWERLKKGRIDMISSDHSPCPTSMKLNEEEDMFSVWGGISGGQFSLELMVDAAHIKRHIPLTDVVVWLSTEPAKRFGFYPQKGKIQLDADADLVLLDLNCERVIEEKEIKSRYPHSPYIGKKVHCQVDATFVRGTLVYDRDKGMVGLPSGKWFK